MKVMDFVRNISNQIGKVSPEELKIRAAIEKQIRKDGFGEDRNDRIVVNLLKMIEDKIDSNQIVDSDLLYFEDMAGGLETLIKFSSKLKIRHVQPRFIDGHDEERVYGIQVFFEGIRDAWFLTGRNLFTLWKRHDHEIFYRHRVPYLLKMPLILTDSLNAMPLGEWFIEPDLPLEHCANYEEMKGLFPGITSSEEDPRHWHLLIDHKGRVKKVTPKEEDLEKEIDTPDSVPKWRISLF